MRTKCLLLSVVCPKMFSRPIMTCLRQTLSELWPKLSKNNIFKTSRSFWDKLSLTRATTSLVLLPFLILTCSRRKDTQLRLLKSQTTSFRTNFSTAQMVTSSTKLCYSCLKWRKTITWLHLSSSSNSPRKLCVPQSLSANLSDWSRNHFSLTSPSIKRLPDYSWVSSNQNLTKVKKRVFNLNQLKHSVNLTKFMEQLLMLNHHFKFWLCSRLKVRSQLTSMLLWEWWTRLLDINQSWLVSVRLNSRVLSLIQIDLLLHLLSQLFWKHVMKSQFKNFLSKSQDTYQTLALISKLKSSSQPNFFMKEFQIKLVHSLSS